MPRPVNPPNPGMAATAAIIGAMGGCTALARAFGCRVQTISNWQAARGIPQKRWPILIRAAEAAGVSAITTDVLREAQRLALRVRVGLRSRPGNLNHSGDKHHGQTGHAHA